MNKLEQIQLQGYKFLTDEGNVVATIKRAIEAQETNCLISLVLLPDRSRVVITSKQERSRHYGTCFTDDYSLAEIIVSASSMESARKYLRGEVEHLIGAATDNKYSEVLINGDDLTLWYLPLHDDDGDLINCYVAWLPKDDTTTPPVCLTEDEAEQLLLREILLDRGYAVESRSVLTKFFGSNIKI